LIDLVSLAKAKDGDYHQEMNRLIFLNWLENQLRPDLKILHVYSYCKLNILNMQKMYVWFRKIK
jgi:hypothetical protein